MIKLLFVSLCLGLALGRTVSLDGTVCSQGLVNCFMAPCQFARCPAQPSADCRDNYCGGCHANFYLNGQLLSNDDCH